MIVLHFKLKLLFFYARFLSFTHWLDRKCMDQYPDCSTFCWLLVNSSSLHASNLWICNTSCLRQSIKLKLLQVMSQKSFCPYCVALRSHSESFEPYNCWISNVTMNQLNHDSCLWWYLYNLLVTKFILTYRVLSSVLNFTCVISEVIFSSSHIVDSISPLEAKFKYIMYQAITKCLTSSCAQRHIPCPVLTILPVFLLNLILLIDYE